MGNKHLAQSGKHAGQWVTCTAEQKCSFGHVDENLFSLTKIWKEQNRGKKISDRHITVSDIKVVENLGTDELHKLEIYSTSRSAQKTRVINKHRDDLVSEKLYEPITVQESEQNLIEETIRKPKVTSTQIMFKGHEKYTVLDASDPADNSNLVPKLATSSTDFVLNVLDAANHAVVGEKVVYPLTRELNYYAAGAGYLRDIQSMMLLKKGIIFSENYNTKTITVVVKDREQLNLIAEVELLNIITQQKTVAKNLDIKQDTRSLSEKLKRKPAYTPNMNVFNESLSRITVWAGHHNIKIG